MSRLSRGENIWRVHDHITDSGGGKWLIFRNACEEDDYWVRREVFAPSRETDSPAGAAVGR